MSGAETDDDKQYEATQTKLDEARKKGDFAKSIDLNTAAAYLGLIAVGVSIGSLSILSLAAELSAVLARSDELADAVFSFSGHTMFSSLLWGVGSWASPWFAIPAAFVLVSLIVQRGIVFAPSKLEFKLSRISIVSQAKNKFGRSGLFEFCKSFVKLVVYSTVLFLFLLGRLPDIMNSMAVSSGQAMVVLLELSMALLAIVWVIASVLGGIDYAWQRAEHLRKNRMSRKEITDEAKNAEGDPAMKQQRRQKAIALATHQMLSDVPDADVIVVNPTHYAVALKWDRSQPGAPICVAKGVDLVAARIREVAQEHAVPVHSDPPTARALHATVEIGQQVPPDHYKAVAAAIRFADKLRKMARS